MENATRAIQLSPLEKTLHPEQLYLLRAVALTYSKKWDEAIENGLMARKLNPRSSDVLLFLATAYRSVKKYHLSCDMAEAAVRLAPRRAQALDTYAFSLLLVNRVEDALHITSEMNRLDDKYLRAYLLKGWCHRFQRKPAFAIKEYDKALAIDSSFVPVLLAKSELLATCTDPACRDGRVARDLAIQACKLQSSKDAESLMILSLAQAECGDFTEATRLAQEALAMPELPKRVQVQCKTMLPLYQRRMPYHRDPEPNDYLP